MNTHTSGAADLPEALSPVHELQAIVAEFKHGLPFDKTSCDTIERVIAALAAGQAVAPVTRIPLATGGDLCFEPYVIGSSQWLWAFRRDNAFVRYLDSFQQEFVNAAVRATRPAPPAMDGGEDALIEALELGLDWAMEGAVNFHEAYKGHRPHDHAAVDADVEKIKTVLAAARAAQKEVKP